MWVDHKLPLFVDISPLSGAFVPYANGSQPFVKTARRIELRLDHKVSSRVYEARFLSSTVSHRQTVAKRSDEAVLRIDYEMSLLVYNSIFSRFIVAKPNCRQTLTECPPNFK